MLILGICAEKYTESSNKRLDCEITPYVYKNKYGWEATNNVSPFSLYLGQKTNVQGNLSYSYILYEMVISLYFNIVKYIHIEYKIVVNWYSNFLLKKYTS